MASLAAGKCGDTSAAFSSGDCAPTCGGGFAIAGGAGAGAGAGGSGAARARDLRKEAIKRVMSLLSRFQRFKPASLTSVSGAFLGGTSASVRSLWK